MKAEIFISAPIWSWLLDTACFLYLWRWRSLCLLSEARRQVHRVSTQSRPSHLIFGGSVNRHRFFFLLGSSGSDKNYQRWQIISNCFCLRIFIRLYHLSPRHPPPPFPSDAWQSDSHTRADVKQRFRQRNKKTQTGHQTSGGSKG